MGPQISTDSTKLDFSSRNDVMFMTRMWKEVGVILSNLSH